MKLKILIVFLGLTSTITAYGQTLDLNLEEVKAVIIELFDGYRAGDSSRVNAVFTKEAQMQTVFTSKEGESKISQLKSIKAFVDYVGGGLKEVHDERLWDLQIHADHQLATVWTHYAFYLGDKFIHCGTETFLLRKENERWLIFYLADTRQKKDCKMPSNFEKKI